MSFNRSKITFIFLFAFLFSVGCAKTDNPQTPLDKATKAVEHAERCYRDYYSSGNAHKLSKLENAKKSAHQAIVEAKKDKNNHEAADRLTKKLNKLY